MLRAFFGRQFLTSSAEPTLWEEIWAYLVDRYFSMNFYEYHYQFFDLSYEDGIYWRRTIVAMLLGVVVASAAAMFQKRTLGDLVRALQREDCNNADKAMTLEQLGLLRNTAIKADLRHGTSLRRVVRCVREQEHLAALEEKKKALEEAAEQGDAEAAAALKKWKELPFHYDFSTDRFYIPQSLMYGAEAQFDKKGSTPLAFAATLIACVILAALFCFFLPEILKMVDNALVQLL